MNKKQVSIDTRLAFVKAENISGKEPSRSKIKLVKSRHFFRVGRPEDLDGDQPKDLIRLYYFQRGCRQRDYHWPKYIAKASSKWYPSEPITERIINRIGELIGLNMAESKLLFMPIVGSELYQLRFLSKFFLLSRKTLLVHGAQIITGAYEWGIDHLEKLEKAKKLKSFLTFKMIQGAINTRYKEDALSILHDFQMMLLFDIFVGNNDRHHYNWGVVESLKERSKPTLAPIYDTARGLYWNTSDEKIIQWYRDSQFSKMIENYCEKSSPKICWSQDNDITHFTLLNELYKSKLGLSRAQIQEFYAGIDLDIMIIKLNEEFSDLIIPQRLMIIIETLKYRYKRIQQIITEQQ